MEKSPMQNHYSAIFISPHLDDAVLSCGGEILSRLKYGPVLVINIFTGFPRSNVKSAVLLGPERKEEENQAAKLLKYESICLDVNEAFFRNSRFQKISKIFLPNDEEIDRESKSLESKILYLLKDVTYDALYIPLGVGWHVDHCISFVSTQKFHFDSKTFFYEEVPYVHIIGALNIRMEQISSNFFTTRDELSHFATWLLAFRSFYHSGMMKNTRPMILRILATPVIGFYLFRLILSHSAKKSQFPNKAHFISVVRNNEEYFEKKLEAIYCYKSQIAPLFAEQSFIRKYYSDYSNSILSGCDGIERYWQIIK